MIKFYSINKSDSVIRHKIINSIKKVLYNNNFIFGNEVFKFEKIFSKFCNAKFAISCSNGTDAITLSLLALNLPKDSEVIIPAMTYASTFYAVVNANLKPIVVDINSDDPLINFELIRKKINKKTRVIIPVHLYGSVVDIKKLKKIINSKRIYIIDDCAQAHGASYDDGKMVGGHGISNISTFSLYPGKNLGAYGDAGIITTNSAKIFNEISKIRNIGSIKKFNHETVGFNNRMDTIQASILLEKIKRLRLLNKKRKTIANKYFSKIKNSNIKFLKYTKGSVFHQFVILVKNRLKFSKFLNKNKIEYGFHYPHSINQMIFFKKKYGIKVFKNAENLASKCISIPIDPMLSKREVSLIIDKLNEFK